MAEARQLRSTRPFATSRGASAALERYMSVPVKARRIVKSTTSVSNCTIE